MISRPNGGWNPLANPNRKNNKPIYARIAAAVAFTYLVGEVLDTHDTLSLTDADISVHMAVLGNSGAGKSKFLEAFLRQRLQKGKAFALWDPHGDLAKSLLAFVAALKADPTIRDDELWRKVHYLELTPECAFCFDPVSRAPLRSVVGDHAYYQWLKTRVDRICKVMLRKVPEADQDMMNRLKRWLKNVLFACLVAYDDKNTHVGLDKALTFTDPEDPQFEMYFDRVKDHLPREVLLDFQKLIGTRRAIDREKWVESTINRLRDCMSPIIKMVYSQAKPSIDIKGIIDRQEFLLIDLKETNDFSQDEKVTVGGLLLMEVLSVKEAEENVPEDQRKEFLCCVDEIGELLGDDLKRALGATRKVKCPIVLGAQDLSTFARGDFDMAAKVLTMCGTVVCFANTFLKDKQILGDRVFCGNRDLFTQRMIEHQRVRGDRHLKIDEISEGYGVTENWTETETKTHSRTHAESIGEALAIAENFSDTSTTSTGLSRRGVTGNPEMGTANKATAVGHAQGGGTTATNNKAATDTKGDSNSLSKALGGGKNQTINIAHKNLIMPNVVSEFEADGTLKEGAPELQSARDEQRIHTLGIGQAAVAIRGRREAVIVQCAEVREWWPDGATKYAAIARMKARLEELHPYCHRPKLRSSASAVADEPEIIDVGNPLPQEEPKQKVANPYGY